MMTVAGRPAHGPLTGVRVVEPAGITRPAPTPRFSTTHTSVRTGPAQPGADTADIARDRDIPGLLNGDG